MKLIVFCILLFSLNSFANTSYQVECFNDDIYTDLGTAKISLNSTITVVSDNNYYLEGGKLTFFIEDAWTDQNVELDKTYNYKKYNPRVYKSHAKFPSIGIDFFGRVDLLIPHNLFKTNGRKEFSGIFILSWVEDHWGGTVYADCILSSVTD